MRGGKIMAQTSVSIRMDADLKRAFDEFCTEIGMTMTTAFCVFAKTAVRERKIPFEISAERSSDPFYSPSNIQYLEGLKRDIEAGNGHFAEHDLIEAD
ncbi:addiction module antitoxin, RelB/DinJ family [Selenomonas flueggei ATCC 43531]|uniref:Addiction module antitoxin, RelB/DinJ family n=2 Tax=Selenomonas TaxID=970 RepID=C4V550_9FIRM|nr:addiction module antitoxin, RelB/DinJ family [Selenomonas flueggei ATCC 43531]